VKNFNFVNVSTKEEALEILNQDQDKVCLVAGGTNVMPFIRTEKINHKTLVNIRNLNELRFINELDDRIVIGPLTTIAELEKSEIVRKYAPALTDAAGCFADPTTRNSATIGGNIANASPAADTAPPLLVLNATVVVESKPQGEKRIPIRDFFKGVNKTALNKDEIITTIEIPKSQANSSSRFIKLGLRNAMAISVASVAAGLELEDGKVKEVNIALGSVAPAPVKAQIAEEFLLEKDFSAQSVEKAAEQVIADISPIDDIRSSAEYRKTVAQVLVKRVLKKVGNI